MPKRLTPLWSMLSALAVSLPVFAETAAETPGALSLYLHALLTICLIMALIFLALILTRKIGDRWGDREAAAKKAEADEAELREKYMNPPEKKRK